MLKAIFFGNRALRKAFNAMLLLGSKTQKIHHFSAFCSAPYANALVVQYLSHSFGQAFFEERYTRFLLRFCSVKNCDALLFASRSTPLCKSLCY